MILSIENQEFYAAESEPISALITQLKHLRITTLRKIGDDYVVVISNAPVRFEISHHGMGHSEIISEQEYEKRCAALNDAPA